MNCSVCQGPREFRGPNTKRCQSCDSHLDRPCGCYHTQQCLIFRTSQRWMEDLGVTILDPDGWDRHNFFYSFHEERITRGEFDRRVAMSTTCLYRPSNEDRIAALEEQVAKLIAGKTGPLL